MDGILCGTSASENFQFQMPYNEKQLPDGFVGSCEYTEGSWTMEDEIELDMISCLPGELALQIFSLLDAEDLVHASATCRTWRILAEDDLLWRRKNQAFEVPDERDLIKKARPVASFPRSLWKINYIRHLCILDKWRTGRHQPPKCLPCHHGFLITCLLFTTDNRIVSGSDDGSLKVWSLETGECVRTLLGHGGGVWAADVDGILLASGSVDRTVRVWSLRTGDLESTFYGHSSTVRCVALRGNICVSGSRDGTLRVWVTEPQSFNRCLAVLLGHTASIRCLRYDGNMIVSGSYDGNVRVWDSQSFKCVHILTGHPDKIYALELVGDIIVSGSHDSSIRVWDARTGALKQTFAGQVTPNGTYLMGDTLIATNTDMTVSLWNIHTGDCLRTLGTDENKHLRPLTDIHFDKNFLITSSDDGTMKLWDMRSGNFIRDIVSLKSRHVGGVVWRFIANRTKLVCAVGSRNLADTSQITNDEEGKLILFDYAINLPC